MWKQTLPTVVGATLMFKCTLGSARTLRTLSTFCSYYAFRMERVVGYSQLEDHPREITWRGSLLTAGEFSFCNTCEVRCVYTPQEGAKRCSFVCREVVGGFSSFIFEATGAYYLIDAFHSLLPLRIVGSQLMVFLFGQSREASCVHCSLPKY